MKPFVALLCLAAAHAFAQDGGTAAVDRVAEQRANALMETLRKQHVGPGPCYRWDRKSAVSELSVQTTAKSLEKSVTSDEVASVVPLFVQWADALEAKAHKLPARDELKAVVKQLAPPEEKAKLEKNPKALEELADRIVSAPVNAKKAQASFNKLSKAKQDALRAAFNDHGPTLRLSFVDLILEMKNAEMPTKPQDDGHGHGP
jgi:3-methyladenine DNA glycosylase/8-oxoguanine DNA glycosylase